MTPNKKICILGKNSFVANGLAKYWDGLVNEIDEVYYDVCDTG